MNILKAKRPLNILWNSLKLFFAIAVFICFSVSTFGTDHRISIEVESFEQNGDIYHFIILETDPQNWDGRSLSDEEFGKRIFAENLLQSTQRFLYMIHQDHGKAEYSGGLDSLILKSFDHLTDPMGRLSWSNSGQSKHKVDDYFEHRSMTFLIIRGAVIQPKSIVGALKFVLTDADRLLAPQLSELSPYASGPLEALESSMLSQSLTRQDVEYENLAKANEGLNPVPLLYSRLPTSSFFRDVIASGIPFRIHLNSEDQMVPYHQRFGFEIDPSYYDGLPAKRLSAPGLEALNALSNYGSQRLETCDRLSCLAPLNPRQVNWTELAFDSSISPSLQCGRFLQKKAVVQ